MPYEDTDGGHRFALRDVIVHARAVFEQGFKLEAVLLAHEYLEQKLNLLYRQLAPQDAQTIHRKFKNLIDMLAAADAITTDDYEVLNEFNRLRNVNSNLILNSSLMLAGAKKGDISKNMDLAETSETIISRLISEAEIPRKKRRKKS